MSTVDDAVEAGARALLAAMSRHEYPGEDREHEWAARQVLPVAHAVWPILSAPLRELADEWEARNPEKWHRFGAQRGIEASRETHADELRRAIQKIDKELGL